MHAFGHKRPIIGHTIRKKYFWRSREKQGIRGCYLKGDGGIFNDWLFYCNPVRRSYECAGGI